MWPRRSRCYWWPSSWRVGKMTTRRAALGGAAGATLVWLSQPAIFVVTGVGLGLAIVAMRIGTGGKPAFWRSC